MPDTPTPALTVARIEAVMRLHVDLRFVNDGAEVVGLRAAAEAVLALVKQLAPPAE